MDGNTFVGVIVILLVSAVPALGFYFVAQRYIGRRQ
jgi:hypothetical protein